MKDEIIHDHDHDGIDRRGFLKCMAWLTGIATYVQWYGLPLRRGVTRLQHEKVHL